MRLPALKVGELAKRTGMTVRALHHYDEIGLLRPSLHTESGHRLYTTVDVGRLDRGRPGPVPGQKGRRGPRTPRGGSEVRDLGVQGDG